MATISKVHFIAFVQGSEKFHLRVRKCHSEDWKTSTTMITFK